MVSCVRVNAFTHHLFLKYLCKSCFGVYGGIIPPPQAGRVSYKHPLAALKARAGSGDSESLGTRSNVAHRGVP